MSDGIWVTATVRKTLPKALLLCDDETGREEWFPRSTILDGSTDRLFEGQTVDLLVATWKVKAVGWSS